MNGVAPSHKPSTGMHIPQTKRARKAQTLGDEVWR
jgi:hypothetical protein